MFHKSKLRKQLLSKKTRLGRYFQTSYVLGFVGLCITLLILGFLLHTNKSSNVSNLGLSKSNISSPTTNNSSNAAPTARENNNKNESVSSNNKSPNTDKSTSTNTANNNTAVSSSTPNQPPTTITGWQLVNDGVDQCSGGSAGDSVYCAPGKTGTWYIHTTGGVTIKKYWEANGLDAGAMDGVTVGYLKVSPTQLRIQVSSNRTYDNFGVTIVVEVNELASPQQSSVHEWFSYKAGCLSSPPISGCAP